VSGEGVFGGILVGALRARERAVITHSSPEPSAAGSEGACSEG
jgi:hypothetical protein